MFSFPKHLRVFAFWVCAVLPLLAAFSASALDPERRISQYNCRTWTRDNGLPANSVNAIAQSIDGRVWLGTSKGLVHFDGIEFHTFNPAGDGAASGQVIACISPRPAGGLWFGLDRGGFGTFDGQEFHFFQQEPWSGPSACMHVVGETRTGSMLVAENLGAAMMGPNRALRSLLPSTNTDTFCMVEDAQGRVWMGTAEHGLFYLESGVLKEFPDRTLRGQIIFSLAVDPQGQLWVGTVSGLRRYDTNFESKPLPDSITQTKALLVDRKGVVWIGTAGSGLARCRNGNISWFRKRDGLASDQVLSLTESRDGSLWVGTADGLTQLSDVKFPIYSASEGLSSEACLAVAASASGDVWAGTGNGMSRYHNGEFTSFGLNNANGFRSVWVKRLFVARNGDVYFIGASKNLDCFRGDHVISSVTNELWPQAIAEDSHGLVVALAGNLTRFENGRFVPFRLADGSTVSLFWINELLVTADDSIWIAHDEGVCQIKDGVLRDWSQEATGTKIRYSFLCEDDHGGVWAAQNAGVARFKDGHLRLITRKQGLYADYIYAMVPDRLGHFWMDSNRGIYEVSQQEMNDVADGRLPAVRCNVYDGPDAVKTTDKLTWQYSGCCSVDGQIWLPSAKGMIRIDPARVPRNLEPPAVFLDFVRINGRQYQTAAEPTLEPGPGNLEFDYSALDYLAPQKIQYRYRLEGYDRDWLNAGSRRSAFYTNLKPGRYRFQVQARNADGVWNKAGAQFGLQLPRRFYETVPFRLGCAAALLAVGAVLWRSQYLRRKQEQLQEANAMMEAKVRERTAELADANTALRSEIEERKLAKAETERLQDELLVASREAGQAEIASSVLHNVGNVLNSVNVSTTVALERVQKLCPESVERVVRLLEEHRAELGPFLTTDEKGRQLPGYLSRLSKHLEEEKTELLAELKELADNVEHIKEIVSMQQAYAKVSGMLEVVEPSDVVDCAVKMHSTDYERHAIRLVREYEKVPAMTVDRHKVLQILVNLLRNAQNACDESGRPEKNVAIRIKPRGLDHLRIEVVDNGVGIPRENLTRIFQHGFTTRKHGHGFGLHSAALAADEMKGSLTAHSDGPGSGATFVLELPVQPQNKSPSPPA